MIPMTQLSLTQLENLAKASGNEIALELIARIDDSVSPEAGKPDSVPSFWDLENEKEEACTSAHDEGYSIGHKEGKEEAIDEMFDNLRAYLTNHHDFTDNSAMTFLKDFMEAYGYDK